MSRYALHINDAEITLVGEQGIVYREPGVALIDEQGLAVGKAAYAKARINPRGIQQRFWSELSAQPLGERRFGHLSNADLASRQLEDVWRRDSGAKEALIVAVPAYLQSDALGLLLGIAGGVGVPIVAMVDAAVAATRREYRNAIPVHVDMSSHATTLTRLAQPGQVQVEQADVLGDCGVAVLYERWIHAIAEAFVQQSRFDPLHTAETEQILLNRLPDWLSQAAMQDSVSMDIEYANLKHSAELESLTLVGAAAPVYQQIASKLRALYRAGEVPALQLTDRVARLPGLADMLKARIGGEVFALEPGATARGALARIRESRVPEGGVSLRRQLPWDQSAFAVEVSENEREDGGQPTHLLFQHTAYPIDGTPLIVGSQALDGSRTLVLGTEMPGVSRHHCTLSLAEGRCVVEDSSRYGTFLNGHRISGSTVLEVGDVLRVGSPGYEMRLIKTDAQHGA